MAYQVKLSPTGKWHRRQFDERGEDNGHTACGLSIDGAYLSREAVLDDQLCPECFTLRERDTGRMRKIELEVEKHALGIARAHELADKWAGEDEEITDEHEPTGEHMAVPGASDDEEG